jgi:hypothetical protein
MKPARRIVLVTYCVVLAYFCLRVPWHAKIQSLPVINVGYYWLWAGPEEGAVDLSIVALRLAAVTAIGAAAFLLSGRWKISE